MGSGRGWVGEAHNKSKKALKVVPKYLKCPIFFVQDLLFLSAVSVASLWRAELKTAPSVDWSTENRTLLTLWNCWRCIIVCVQFSYCASVRLMIF